MCSDRCAGLKVEKACGIADSCGSWMMSGSADILGEGATFALILLALTLALAALAGRVS